MTKSGREIKKTPGGRSSHDRRRKMEFEVFGKTEGLFQDERPIENEEGKEQTSLPKQERREKI